MENRNKIAIAIVIVLIVAFIVSMATQDNRRWNNGECPDCGEHWELIKEVPGHGANESAEIWQCTNCHKTITLGASGSIKTMLYICLGCLGIGVIYIIKTKINKKGE